MDGMASPSQDNVIPLVHPDSLIGVPAGYRTSTGKILTGFFRKRLVPALHNGGRMWKLLIGSIMAVASSLLGFILISHERRLNAHAKKATATSEDVQRLLSNQDNLQQHINKRLEYGDRHFRDLQQQMQNFQATTTELRDITQRLEVISQQTQQHLQTLDDRIYQQQGQK